MVAKLNVPKLFQNPPYESDECDAGAEADLVHIRGNGRAAALPFEWLSAFIIMQY